MKVLRMIHTALVVLYIMMLFFFVSLSAFVPYFLLRILGKRGRADQILRSNGRFLSRRIIQGFGGTVSAEGLEKFPADAERICIVSNHQSLIDIPLLVGYLPVWAGFIAKEELTGVPFLRQWMRAMGCVYIMRGNPRSSIKMILDGVKAIKSGNPLIIFPEGTRSRSNTVNPFKPGSLKLATRSKSLLIPVTIQNTYHLWEEEKLLHPSELLLIIHDPIDTAELGEGEEKLLPQRVEAIISSSAQQAERSSG